jgi:hypothetical protein
MKRATAIALCSVLAASCAAKKMPSTEVLADDRDAVAHAVVYVMSLAPAGREYQVQLESPLSTAAVLERISKLAGARLRGHLLQGPADAGVSRVVVRANRPKWAEHQELRSATVAVAYVAGQEAGACDIVIVSSQSAIGTKQWSINARSGVPCRRKQ